MANKDLFDGTIQNTGHAKKMMTELFQNAATGPGDLGFTSGLFSSQVFSAI